MSVADRIMELQAAKNSGKFKVGDRVRRNPKIWKIEQDPKKEAINIGTIAQIEEGRDNRGKMQSGYIVKFDAFKNGVADAWNPGRMLPDKGQWFSESELIPYVKGKK